MVANKCDLKWAVEKKAIEQLCEEEKVDYVMASAKTGENVENAFIKLCQKVKQKFLPIPPNPGPLPKPEPNPVKKFFKKLFCIPGNE